MKLHLPAAALRAAGLHPPVVQVDSETGCSGWGQRVGLEGEGLSQPSPCAPLPREPGSPWSPLVRLYSLGCIFCVFLKQGGRGGG